MLDDVRHEIVEIFFIAGRKFTGQGLGKLREFSASQADVGGACRDDQISYNDSGIFQLSDHVLVTS